MFYKDIRSLSRKLNKNKYVKSFSITVFALTVTAILCVLPFCLNLMLSISGIKDILKNTDARLSAALMCLFMIIITFIGQIFYSSIFMGEKAWYTGRLTKRKLCFKRFIYWFKPKNSFKALRLTLSVTGIKLLWTALFLSPSVLTFAVATTLAFTGGVEVYLFFSLLGGGAVLLVTGLAFSFIIAQKYFLAPYLLAENPKLKVLQCIKQSKNLTEGQIFTLVRFKLCFMPRFLLYPLILPAIFLHPHYKQSCCIIAKELRL